MSFLPLLLWLDWRILQVLLPPLAVEPLLNASAPAVDHRVNRVQLEEVAFKVHRRQGDLLADQAAVRPMAMVLLAVAVPEQLRPNPPRHGQTRPAAPAEFLRRRAERAPTAHTKASLPRLRPKIRMPRRPANRPKCWCQCSRQFTIAICN